MQVLPFTIVLCFIFILMTYARLENFLNFSIVRSQFVDYMQKMERDYSNIETIRIYTDTIMTKYSKTNKDLKDEDDKTVKEQQAKTSSMLSVLPLISQTKKESDNARYQQARLILQSLMEGLYSDQPFYKEFEQKNPQFVTELLNRIEMAAKNLPNETKITQAAQINTLDLQDPDFNELLYKILKGTPDVSADDKNRANIKHRYDYKGNLKDDIGDVVVDNNVYDTLLDYITLENAKTNVYLASRPLLKALFMNPATVEEIIKFRNSAYSSIRANTAPKAADDLSNEFKSRYYNLLRPNIDENLVDFKVSKTDPRKYE